MADKLNRIVEKVNSIIEKYKTRDPFLLCEEMGIMVLRLDLPKDTFGIYVKLSGINTVILNKGLGYVKSRIVCAHELGHIVLHDGTNYLDLERNTNYVLTRYEYEADTFAAHLLIDKHVIYENDINEASTISKIALRTGLPESLVKLRFNL